MLASPAGAQTTSESAKSKHRHSWRRDPVALTGCADHPQSSDPEPGLCSGAPDNGVDPHAELSPGTNETGSSILIAIDKAKQKMTVSVDGVQQYEWPVSTGRAGYSTPSGTYTPTSMNEVWYSQEWDNAPMPHAIFFMKDGHAIHGSYEVKT